MALAPWSEASPYILATGQEVMPMGGFTGSVPEPALATVKELVHTGQLRFFLLNGSAAGAGFAMGGQDPATTAIASWVRSTCAKVPARDYGGTSSSPSASGSGAGGGTGTLFACSTGHN
jgi:4-amino-4-deoxy-L-arabinose transferase-like glycosyltransferase